MNAIDHVSTDERMVFVRMLAAAALAAALKEIPSENDERPTAAGNSRGRDLRDEEGRAHNEQLTTSTV